MYRRLLQFEFKSFIRNPQFGTNLVLKILTFIGFASFAFVFALLPFGIYFFAKEELQTNPLQLFCKYFIFYWAADLLIRYFFQAMPTQNIKPFLTTGLKKNVLVNYTMLKIITHFFNWGNLLFLIPFAGLLIFDGDFSAVRVIAFALGIYCIFYFNNFLNIILNGKDWVVFLVFGLVALLGILEYYHFVEVTTYSERIFYSMYQYPFLAIIPLLAAVGVAILAYRLIYNDFYLDKGLELKKASGKSENIEFLNRFGVTGTFINNDIRLLKRSKAARSALVMSFLFLFYGLLFFNGFYEGDYMKLFGGIFVSGGFMMMFGQRVPSWDSSYYPLMMTQNVPYKKYLMGKWALIVLGIVVSLILSTAYLFLGLEVYLTVFAAGLYNLGVNSYIVLLAGAFNRQPIDLNSSTKSYGGGKNNFNMKTMLLTIPQLLSPVLVFTIMKYFFGIYGGVASLGILGIIGFLLKDIVFDYIVKVYQSEKYKTLEAFKKTE